MNIDPANVDLSRVHLRRLVSEEEAQALIESAQASGLWQPALRRHDESDHVGTLTPEDWDASLILEREHPEMFATVRSAMQNQLDRLMGKTVDDPVVLERFVLLRYEVGGHLYEHVDASPTYNRYRRYSIVCYLNDDYDGGTTSFPSVGSDFRGKAGEALIFPASYRHRGEPVRNGIKFVLVTFICDPSTAPVGV